MGGLRPSAVARWFLATAVSLWVAVLPGRANAALVLAPADDLPGRYIVVLVDEADPHLMAEVFAGSTGGSVLQIYSHAIKGLALGGLSAEAASILAGDRLVRWVEPDRRMEASRADVAASWGLDRVDQRSRPLDLNYRYAQTGSGVRAYVLDTGIRISHDQFAGRASYGYNFIENTSAADDGHGHGTHVAGTLGGTLVGVAKAVSLISVRVLGNDGSGTTSSVLAGIDWVTRNAIHPAVVNMSLGGPSSPSLDLAVSNSIAGGLTYCVAAGNDAQDAGLFSPARVPSAITVGATSRDDVEAAFSNTGASVKILAPGMNILSASILSDNALITMSGTSMAAPHVAGAAALYLELNPSATPARVREAIQETATRDAITGMKSPLTPNLLAYTLGFAAGDAGGPPEAASAGSAGGAGCGLLGFEGLLALWILLGFVPFKGRRATS